MILDDIPALRLQVATYENDLETVERDYQVAKAHVEEHTIAGTGYDLKALGGNEGEQKRRLAYAVLLDSDCKAKLERANAFRAGLRIAEANLAGAIDRRRTHEWSIRDRIARAMEGADADFEPVDAAIDEPTPLFQAGKAPIS